MSTALIAAFIPPIVIRALGIDRNVMIPRFLKPALLSKRIPPILTLVLAPIILALSIVVLLSRGDSNGLERNFVVKLNTSTLLQDVFKVRPVPGMNIARAVLPPQPSITSFAQLDDRQLFPSSGEVNSFFSSVGSRFSTVLIPSATTVPTGDATAGGGSQGGGVGSIFPGLGGGNSNGGGAPSNGPGITLGSLLGNGTLRDLISNGPLGNFFNNLGGQAATGLVSIINGVLKEAVGGIGAADQYGVYLKDICSANVTTRTQTMGPQQCSPLRDLAPVQEGLSPKSTIQVGNVLVDYSAVNIPAKLNGGATLIRTLFDAIFAFQVIGIVATVVLLLVSPFLLFSIFQFRLLRLLASVLAILSAVFLTLVAIIETLIGTIVPNIVNQIGDGLGVSASSGRSMLAMTVVSSAFAGTLAGQWIVNLIVSYHDRTYVRREMDDDDMVHEISSRKRGLRRPIIRLNTPSNERLAGKEDIFSAPGEGNGRETPLRPFRAFIGGGPAAQQRTMI